MELSEENQLKSITEEFTKGVALFRERKCQNAFEIFNRIIEEYKDSQYYSVLEIQSRSKFYKMLCEAQLNPVKTEGWEDEDYLNDGIFHLNAGNLDKALERFKYLEEKKYNNSNLNYLLSLVHLKNGDNETCLMYLKMAIKADEFFKIIAYNEPDFESMFEKNEFTELVEMGNLNMGRK
jgi:tetratricopeptide (TPR) repeat protein